MEDLRQGTRASESPLDASARRQRYRGWKAQRRRRNIRDHQIPLAITSSDARRQKVVSSPPLMQLMKYVVPAVLVLLTLKYQRKPESLFQENPAPLWCFLAAFCLYWLLEGAMKQMTVNGKCFQTLRHAALASAILSAVSLASIFLPHHVSLPHFTIWISLPVVLALPYTYSFFHGRIVSVINKINVIVVWAKGLINPTVEAPLPV